MTAEPTMSAAELQEENHALRVALRELPELRHRLGELERRVAEWRGSELDCHFDARCDALSQRVEELEGQLSLERAHAKAAEAVVLDAEWCSAEERKVLDVLERRRIVLCPGCQGRGSGPGPCRAICKQCEGQCLCVDDDTSAGPAKGGARG